MQIVETIALISVNGTLIFQLISFLIFLFLIKRIMLQPLQQQATERKTHLDSIARAVAAARTSYDDLNHQMALQEEEVRRTASAARNELEAAGKAAAVALLTRTRDEISTIRDQASKENAARIAVVRKELGAEAESIARQMMVSLLGRRVDAA